MNRMVILLGAVFLIFVGVMSSIFVVDEREKVLVLQFGRVVATKKTLAYPLRSDYSKRRKV